MTPSLNYFWQGKFAYTDETNLYPNAVVPSYGLVNARLEFETTKGLQVALFIRNLTDKTYIQTGDRTVGIGRVLYGEPQTFGIQITKKFGG